MNRKIPIYNDKFKLLIICEGYEEEDYLNKLKSLNVWNSSLNITILNAKSIDKISSIYHIIIKPNHIKVLLFSAIQKKIHTNNFY